MQSIYDFSVKNAKGDLVSLAQYKGKVLLIVNVASKCGFTKQYANLEMLYRKYKDQGLEILAFPCNQFLFEEPGNNDQIQSFCKTQYDITFPVFAKVNVNGKGTDDLYVYLKNQKGGVLGNNIKWNFTKFLINKEGQVIKRFPPYQDPLKFEKILQEYLT